MLAQTLQSAFHRIGQPGTGRTSEAQAMTAFRRGSRRLSGLGRSTRKAALKATAEIGLAGPSGLSDYKKTHEVHDWRIKQMLEVCHRYYKELWSAGNLEAAEEILDSNFVYKDMVWSPKDHALISGPSAMKSEGRLGTFVRFVSCGQVSPLVQSLILFSNRRSCSFRQEHSRGVPGLQGVG
jgi:hypothetical protein